MIKLPSGKKTSVEIGMISLGLTFVSRWWGSTLIFVISVAVGVFGVLVAIRDRCFERDDSPKTEN
jgi:hypothetical protein